MEVSLLSRQQTQIPIDNKCEICQVNELRYYQKEKHVCLYCWTRVAHPELSDKTDDEIQTMRELNNKTKETKTTKLVNMGSFIGFQ